MLSEDAAKAAVDSGAPTDPVKPPTTVYVSDETIPHTRDADEPLYCELDDTFLFFLSNTSDAHPICLRYKKKSTSLTVPNAHRNSQHARACSVMEDEMALLNRSLQRHV